MNFFEHWNYFQKPDRDFMNLSFVKQTIVPDIQSLNERRKQIQKEISFLSSVNETCRFCPTSCCRGDYNHFTIVDFMLRLFSDKPIKEFGEIQRKQPALITIFLDKIKTPKVNPAISQSVSNSKCPNLTANGCAFPSEDRPIRCILYTCKMYRMSLPEENLEKIGVLTKELSSISSQVFVLFSR